MFYFSHGAGADPAEGPRTMAGFAIGRRRAAAGSGRPRVFRWECRCQENPFLLATYDADGRINIKVGDRYWHVDGQVRTICPRCGAEHVLDLRDVEGDRPREEGRSRRAIGREPGGRS
jgi:hypothetical protein